MKLFCFTLFVALVAAEENYLEESLEEAIGLQDDGSVTPQETVGHSAILDVEVLQKDLIKGVFEKDDKKIAFSFKEDKYGLHDLVKDENILDVQFNEGTQKWKKMHVGKNHVYEKRRHDAREVLTVTNLETLEQEEADSDDAKSFIPEHHTTALYEHGRVLPYLSYALGKAGASGHTHSISFWIHRQAMRAAKEFDIDKPECSLTLKVEGKTINIEQPQSKAVDLLDVGVDAIDTLEVDSKQGGSDCGCLLLGTNCGIFGNSNCWCKCCGLCGKGCWCWHWVCENCNYNRGCYEHDADSCRWNMLAGDCVSGYPCLGGGYSQCCGGYCGDNGTPYTSQTVATPAAYGNGYDEECDQRRRRRRCARRRIGGGCGTRRRRT